MIDYLILYRNPGYIQDISVLFLAFAEAHGMSLLSLLLLFKQKGQRIEKENNANQFTKRELGPRLYCQVQNLMLLFTGEILAGFQHLHPWLEYKPDEINAERFDGAYRGSMDTIFNGG